MDVVSTNMNSVERENPTVDMPGQMALVMRTMNLFLGLAFSSGANVDFRQIVLRYAQEPEGVTA